MTPASWYSNALLSYIWCFEELQYHSFETLHNETRIFESTLAWLLADLQSAELIVFVKEKPGRYILTKSGEDKVKYLNSVWRRSIGISDE